MCLWVRAFALLLLVSRAAGAQETRDDAIRVLLAGDYQRAARALQALADDPATPDPAAQFLLAILYDSGQGVPRNPMRACGLYRQAAGASGPFRETAATLGRMLHEDSPVPEQMCSAGPFHEQPEVSFTLGPDHSVQFTSNAILVRYRDAERRIVTGNLPGVVPLPALYTPLEVTQPVRERRHFLQSFFWSPDHPATPATWELIWGLSEVVGAEFVQVTFVRNVVTMSGPKPPTTLDLSSLAKVQVGVTGEAEWITTGANGRRAIIQRRDRQ
jgi:hypothetical protein